MMIPIAKATQLEHSSRQISRRLFLHHSLTVVALATVPVSATQAFPSRRRPFRAAIIGHTGQGNYGHDHDLIFNGREDITVVAVADPDAGGRTRATSRSHALRSYADYREMLEQEKPELVCIAPRWTDEHHAMALAALRVGAHLYLEKPITKTLAEADELLAAADRAGMKTVVAHQVRLAPNILALKQAIQAGLLGEVLEIRSHGKQDQRAGGEDLVVLGVHLFDLMRFFVGDPRWCAAWLLQAGHEINSSDARAATEHIGPVVGDEITASFAFAQGVQASFISRAKNREVAGPWGLELIGTKASVKILMEMVPKIYLLRHGPWQAQGKQDEWRPWEQDPTLHWTDGERNLARANARVVDDWLAAIREDREPQCSGRAGMKALEMAMAVFAAGLTRGRVAFPLTNRQHPLLER